jgi:hypothetical protein
MSLLCSIILFWIYCRRIHEAARTGHLEIIEYLISQVQDNQAYKRALINAITSQGHGMSPLSIALKNLKKDHPLVDYLRSLGGVEYSHKTVREQEL